MATVVSLTEAKIRELLASYDGVALSQEELEALVQQIKFETDQTNAEMELIRNSTIPQLNEDVASSSNEVANLRDVVIPTLEITQDQQGAQINDLLTVTIPTLEADLASTATTVRESPQTYYDETMPTNPDADGRDLVVGDTWYAPLEDNKEYTWNGVDWTTMSVSADIADFSLTAEKFATTRHMIY